MREYVKTELEEKTCISLSFKPYVWIIACSKKTANSDLSILEVRVNYFLAHVAPYFCLW